MTGLFLSHPSSLAHDTGGHPERALRLETLQSKLAEVDWLGWERVTSPPVERDVLELTHPKEHIELIRRAADQAGDSRVALDADTIVSGGSYEAALHAAGGAVELVRRLTDGTATVGFSAHRPPGHHCERARPMGFCLFNNVAVAANYALASLDRVAIVDWDVHHGNGTQDIFWSSEQVLYASIHQIPLYPGTGLASETGGGYTLNLPVSAGAGDDTWVALLRGQVVPRLKQFAPELLLISAGFDAHRDDPLASCTVTEAGFAAMADALADLELPLGLVLEGGYNVHALARSVIAVMEAVGGGG